MPETGHDIQRLASGLGREGYTTWLRVGLQQFFFEKRGARALLGLGESYGSNPSIGDDIVEAVQRLPARDRENFREAVVEIIRETSLGTEPLYLEALLLVASGAARQSG